MKNSIALTITQTTLDGIMSAAKKADSQECMGLIASGAGDGPLVCGACLLPARATGSHAESDPLAIRQSVEFFRRRRQRPMGLWHSHGNHGVFHSTTDDDTVMRLLPAMAEWSFQRPRVAWPVPSLTEPDSAVMPLRDGRWIRLTLMGPSVPGLTDGHVRVAWDRINIAFRPKQSSPRMIHEADSLRLIAGGVELRLGVPEGGSVVSRIEDHAAVRSARLFSLVVNRRGEYYAEVVTVHDFDDELHISKRACAVAVIRAPEAMGDDPEKRVLDLVGSPEGLCIAPQRGSDVINSGPRQEALS
jgi:Prokaryotic homologs of the JAB domain